jgi:hypothetical protein
MANCLLVGDVHATLNELEDCNNLIDCIEFAIKKEATNKNKIDYLVFLGDLTHNHAIVNIYVLDFWKKALERLKPLVNQIICLVGNHDVPGDTGSNSVNSLNTLDNLCLIVQDFFVIDEILFVSHQHDKNKFIDICHKNSDVNTVLCHQTFNGAKYENGFPAKDGIDTELLPTNQRFFSGHIHKPDSFGVITYVGAPRWRTISDGDVDCRYLHLLRPILDTHYVSPSVNTDYHCKRILNYRITPDNKYTTIGSVITAATPNCVLNIDLTGPQEWIDGCLDKLKKTNTKANVRTFPTDDRKVVVKESEGIDISLNKYLESCNIKSSKDEIKKLIESRVWNRNR